MAGIKEIRTRIVSVTSTMKITSAMKMVSAAKLRKAQNAVIQMRPYSQKLGEIFVNISSGLDSIEDNIYARERTIEKVAIIVVTSNSGLCGAFNTNVVKQAVSLAREKYADQLSQGCVDFYCIGKKGIEQLKGRGFIAKANYNSLYEKITYEKVVQSATQFMEMFTSGKYDAIDLVYNKFKNAASQVLTTERFLPVDLSKKIKAANHGNNYIFEPSTEEIIDNSKIFSN